MRFSDLNFQPHNNFYQNGIQAVAKFPNNYGLSVVRFPGSYGYEFGQFECAVLKFIDDDFKIDYTTPICDDVVGFLTTQEVEELLQKVEAL